MAVGAVAGGGVAAVALGTFSADTAEPVVDSITVTAAGVTQAGVDRPETPQKHCLISVLDVTGTEVGFLATLGSAVLSLVTGGRSDLLPDGPGDLSVTIGIGPRLVATLGADLPGSADLPDFAGDQDISPSARGGDLLLAVHSTDPSVLGPVSTRLRALVPGESLRWSQHGFRGPGTGTVVRNPLGFDDGIIVPRGEAELAENVWLDGALAGGTICVIRRLKLDTTGFQALTSSRQEAVIGRHKVDGSPLSGGGRMDEVNLGLKSPDGEYLVPARSHARAAHPSFTGSGLMLRRGYAYDNGSGTDGSADAGLMFICFQRELRTFVATQQRLDEVDDLMSYATPTASGTFLILPGYSSTAPLGVALNTL
ncbi:Dyp-type peroxidase [Nakamurella silvestris]|nr:Dyp-type peroxidase [Nakamurella silvestris]